MIVSTHFIPSIHACIPLIHLSTFFSYIVSSSYGNLTSVTEGLYFKCDSNTSLTVLSCNSSNKPEVRNCLISDVAAVECCKFD